MVPSSRRAEILRRPWPYTLSHHTRLELRVGRAPLRSCTTPLYEFQASKSPVSLGDHGCFDTTEIEIAPSNKTDARHLKRNMTAIA